DFVAPDPFKVGDLFNRMADGAGDTLLVIGARELGARSKRARDERDGVVTAFAVARDFDPVLVDQQLDVFLVERLAETISVRRLFPLRVCILVGRRAVSRWTELGDGDKGASRSRHFAWRERVRPKSVTVVLLHCVSIR